MPGARPCQRICRSLTAPCREGSVAASSTPLGEAEKMTSKKSFNLEKSLAELESLVEELESGDLPLEKAMKKFEEGIRLTRGCQAALKEAEQKVDILMKSAGGQETLQPFAAD